MKVSFKKYIFLLILSYSGYQSFTQETLAITNCSVITMKSPKVLKNQTILISGNSISDIVSADKWENVDNVPIIDGTGKYVMPGLTDMHMHINQYSNWVFPILLSYGVTTVRIMAGNEAALAWRDSIRLDLKVAPDLYVASEVFDGRPPYWGSLHEGPVIQDADSVDFHIENQMRKGYDFLKTYNRLESGVIKKIRKISFARNIKLLAIPQYILISKIFLLKRQVK